MHTGEKLFHKIYGDWEAVYFCNEKMHESDKPLQNYFLIYLEVLGTMNYGQGLSFFSQKSALFANIGGCPTFLD